MQILFFLSLLFLLSSCDKDENGEAVAKTYIEYQVDGDPVKINGQLAPDTSAQTGVIAWRSVRGIFVNNFYEILGRNGGSERIELNIPADSLEERTYYLNDSIYSRSAQAGVAIYHKGNRFTVQTSSDFTNIIITSHKNGYVSGTFTGSMSRYDPTTSSYKSTTITNGLFTNVQLSY